MQHGSSLAIARSQIHHTRHIGARLVLSDRLHRGLRQLRHQSLCGGTGWVVKGNLAISWNVSNPKDWSLSYCQ